MDKNEIAFNNKKLFNIQVPSNLYTGSLNDNCKYISKTNSKILHMKDDYCFVFTNAYISHWNWYEFLNTCIWYRRNPRTVSYQDSIQSYYFIKLSYLKLFEFPYFCLFSEWGIVVHHILLWNIHNGCLLILRYRL